MAKDMKVYIAYDELWVEIMAEGVSYAPDALHDMMTQAIRGFSETISELRGHGIIVTKDDVEEELEEEAEEEEEEEE